MDLQYGGIIIIQFWQDIVQKATYQEKTSIFQTSALGSRSNWHTD